MRKVLLTNDDGYEADGVRAMGAALVEAGYSVTMLAPAGNRSAMGHRITVRDDLLVEDHGVLDGLRTLSCSGTPADCVRVGVLGGLFERPDVVVSGINHGVNLGDDVRYSGTVSAAAEAALLGLPAVAISQQGDDPTIRFLAERPTRFEHLGLLANLVGWFADRDADGTFLNVNVPSASPEAALRWSTLGNRQWRDVQMTVERDDSAVVRVKSWASDPLPVLAPGSDFAAVGAGAVAVSLLTVHGGLVDLTHRVADEFSQPRGDDVLPLAR
jgi:5'-nucleotidase